MGKKSNSKGKRGEREFARMLSNWGYTARRSQQYQGVPVEGAGDVIVERLSDHFRFEVKRYKDNAKIGSRRIHEWIEQAAEETPKGKLPVVAFRPDYGEWTLNFRIAAMTVRARCTQSNLRILERLAEGGFIHAKHGLAFIDKENEQARKNQSRRDGLLDVAGALRAWSDRLAAYAEGQGDPPSGLARGEQD